MRTTPSRSAALALISLLLAACSDDPSDPFVPEEPSDPPPEVTLTVTESVGHPLTLGLDVAVSPQAAVTVEYWTEGEPHLRVQSAAAETHEVLLARLLPDTTYQYMLTAAFDDASAEAEPIAGSFRTDTLPTAVRAVQLDVTGETTSPLVMLDLWDGPFRGFAAVDSKGRIVWYHSTPGGAWGWTRRASGSFVFIDSNSGLNEVTPGGEIVASLPDAEGDPFHHDVIATPQNTVYAIGRHADTVPGGLTWAGEAIWEWDPDTGLLARRWSSFDHLSPASDTTERSSQGDWIHGNSLNIGPEGHVLLSSPWLNQVIAIAPDFSSLAWRLGGKNATIFTDSASTFDFQHTASQLSPNRVLMFDNRGGSDETTTRSRALELELDFAADSARAVWSFVAPNDNYASIVSAARRLANGNTMVAFGTADGLRDSHGPIEVYEVTPAGDIVWNLVVGGVTVMYRATPFQDIAGEAVVE